MKPPNVTEGEWKCEDGRVFADLGKEFDEPIICDLNSGFIPQNDINGRLIAQAKRMGEKGAKLIEALESGIMIPSYVLEPMKEFYQVLLDAGWTE